MITRRNCILSGLGAALSARISGAAEFWNSKEPAEWSEEDISRVLNKSPWAKETTIHFRQDLMYGPGGGGGRRGGRGGGGGGMAGPENGGGMGGPGGGMFARVNELHAFSRRERLQVRRVGELRLFREAHRDDQLALLAAQRVGDDTAIDARVTDDVHNREDRVERGLICCGGRTWLTTPPLRRRCVC